LGGLAERASLIESLREEDPELILVDTGDLFGVDDKPRRAEVVVEAYLLAAYDLIALGDQDLLRGELSPGWLLERLPVACANVSPFEKGLAAFPATLVLERRGVKVGLTAVIHPDCFSTGPDLAGLGYGVSDWREPLRRAVEGLETAGCEVIVVLSHLGVPGEVEIAEGFPRVDLVIGGHSGLFRRQPELAYETPVVWPGRRGRYVGVARLSLAPDTFGRLVSYEAIPVDGEVLEVDPATRAVILAYEHERYESWLERFYEPEGEYAWSGADYCGSCHAAQYEQWAATPHAHAWETLVATGDDRNLECIRCHATGFGKPGGFGSEELTPHLSGVGCQMCHQTSVEHPAGGRPPELEARTCAACHKPGYDDDFSFSRDTEFVNH
jgi:hypothetical protein